MSKIQEAIQALKSGHYNADTFRYEFANKSIIPALMVAEEALEKQGKTESAEKAPQTNFDRITENPDKLAEFLRANLKDCYHCPADTPGCGENCKQAWINWLNLGVSK